MTRTCAPSLAGSKSRMFSENKVTKTRAPAGAAAAAAAAANAALDGDLAEEMQELLCKLKELVPSVPRHRKLSKLEIIQHVIDYIFDLQQALDSQPSDGDGPAFASLRQPLSTLSYPSL